MLHPTPTVDAEELLHPRRLRRQNAELRTHLKAAQVLQQQVASQKAASTRRCTNHINNDSNDNKQTYFLPLAPLLLTYSHNNHSPPTATRTPPLQNISAPIHVRSSESGPEDASSEHDPSSGIVISTAPNRFRQEKAPPSPKFSISPQNNQCKDTPKSAGALPLKPSAGGDSKVCLAPRADSALFDVDCRICALLNSWLHAYLATFLPCCMRALS